MTEPHRRLVGAAAMAAGVLIALAFGVGTVLIVGVTLAGMAANPSNLGLMLTGVFSGALAMAIFGGLPTVAGILLFRWGHALWRPPPDTHSLP